MAVSPCSTSSSSARQQKRMRAATALALVDLAEEEGGLPRQHITSAAGTGDETISRSSMASALLDNASPNPSRRQGRRRRGRLLVMGVTGVVGALGVLQRSSTLPPSSSSDNYNYHHQSSTFSQHGGMLQLRGDNGGGLAAGMLRLFTNGPSYGHGHGRSLSLALPNGSECPTNSHNAEAPPIAAHLSDRPLPDPAVLASYPGSGSQMAQRLVEGLTHLATGDEHVLHLRDSVPLDRYVAVHTYFPHKAMGDEAMRTETEYVPDIDDLPPDAGDVQRPDEEQHDHDHRRTFPRAILLLRSPADALASFHDEMVHSNNHKDNRRSSDPADPTAAAEAQAPLDASIDEWVAWRDAHFADEVQAWEDHTAYWTAQYAPRRNSLHERLVVTYEGMTGDESGPRAAHLLADFLGRAGGVHPVEGTDVDCVWTGIVQEYTMDKGMGEEEVQAQVHGPPPPPPPAAAAAAAAAPEEEQQQQQHLEASNQQTQEEAVVDLLVPVETERRDRRRRRLQVDASGDYDSIARTAGSKQFRPYTQEQVVEMLAMLDRLRERFGGDGDSDGDNDDLLSVLDFYSEQIRRTYIIDLEQQEEETLVAAAPAANVAAAGADEANQYPIPAATATTTTSTAGIRGNQIQNIQPPAKPDPSLAVYSQALRRVDEPEALSPADKAFFYHIPKAGGTSIEAYYHYCLDIPMPHIDAVEGIDANAFEDASFLKTNMMHHKSLFLDKPFKARVFSVFRHPVEQVQSEYYYLQTAVWEKGYNKDLGKQMSLEEYAASRPDRMTHNILQIGHRHNPLVNDESLARAKTILRDYVMVGLLDHMVESVARFDTYLGTADLISDREKIDQCRDLLAQKHENTGKHPKLTEDSEEWRQVAAHNEYDIALYEYAIQLFSEQGSLYPQQ